MGEGILIQHLVTLMGMLARELPDEQLTETRRLRGDAGMTTETVIIIAGLAALAIAVVAIIVTKVTAKANSIPTQ
jgi:hypothetical protein